MIKIEGLQKKYGSKEILTNISLHVKKGEIFGLLGSNGAGKSTLLSILSSLIKPSDGVVKIGEYSILKQRRKIREMIGFVPQEITLVNDLTVKENMKFWSHFTNRKVDERYLRALCDKVQLNEQWNDKVSNLSGGMKRKLNIAVSLIHDPQVLLMDEPTVGIDLQSKWEINQYIKELASNGKTVLYTTHDVEEIVNVCDRIGVLKNGTMSFVGTVKEAKNHIDMNNEHELSDQEVIYRLLTRD
ncbi:ABC transporter ATP-binding protein [Bacillus solimangrovi]|uniref:ABC transporter ATP-binding protein n=1 Tax=Bacillus solimangrovi TaxID=1305675 RepID=A0A1E5LBA4_9BACI|nr:ABC transporter ATP-binding protein [Bacillus solimangrovi]OEH91368.1 ABC transporter ATP-binding protein [Bacillus solimangrovi]